MRVFRTFLLFLGLASLAACSTAPLQDAAPLPAAAKRAPAAPPLTAQEDLSELPRSFTVYFDFDSSEIRASAMQILWEASQVATKLKPAVIRVRGYTDAAGNAAYNRKLADRRAAAVAAQLVKLGISVAAIEARGQAAGPRTAKVKDKNERERRVELTLEGGMAFLPVATAHGIASVDDSEATVVSAHCAEGSCLMAPPAIAISPSVVAIGDAKLAVAALSADFPATPRTGRGTAQTSVHPPNISILVVLLGVS